jgi:hypothetical protein
MRVTGEAIQQVADDVLGTSYGDRLEVSVFRDGVLVAERLDVVDWTMDWSYGRSAHGQGTFVVADPSGDITPWAMTDPLGPGGSRLLVTYVFGVSGMRVPMGWWRVRRTIPNSAYRIYQTSDGPRRTWAGGSLSIRADEITCLIDMARLDAERPVGPTCIEEVRRLVRDLMPVRVVGDVVDGPLPSLLIYDDSRVSAVNDTLSAIDAEARAGADGSLEIVPRFGVGPVWDVHGGDSGVLINVSHALSDEGVYNAVISHGQTEEGAQIVGRAYITTGPMRWGGPFGQVPMFHNAIATSQAGVDSDAASMLANRVATGTVPIEVTCLTHPGIQIYDRLALLTPTVAGDIPIEGFVTHMTMSSARSDGDAAPTPSKSMTLTLAVLDDDLAALAQRVNRS